VAIFYHPKSVIGLHTSRSAVPSGFCNGERLSLTTVKGPGEVLPATHSIVIRCAPSWRNCALRCCIEMKWTRRKFINSSVGGMATASTLISAGEIARGAGEPKLSAGDAQLLKIVVGEIIPAGDGMPSANEVGGVEYLAMLMHEEPQGIGKEIHEALAGLNQLSKQHMGSSFDRLDADARVRVLKDLERSSPHRFTMLRDSVYEAYYTQATVWRLIGYELFPTDHAGPHMKPFDEKILSAVRNKPKYYREA
jgi:hypothetical protein